MKDLYPKGNKMQNQRFYKHGNIVDYQCELPQGYTWKLWSPNTASIIPPTGKIYPFLIWYCFHILKIFKNNNYSILIIYFENKAVHRSCVFPGFFRFPFMLKPDLQIGDTWTDPEHGGKGLASFALSKIIEIFSKEERIFWYIVQDDNIPSIKVVEKNEFTLFGLGKKAKRICSSFLGYYVVEKFIE